MVGYQDGTLTGFLIYLSDAVENKQIASLSMIVMSGSVEVLSCTVSGRKCRDKDQWESLIKPYMEE